jgi:hypothetical protein
MTRDQMDRIVTIIQTNCQTRGVYKDPETGETCALGALLEAAGIQIPEAFYVGYPGGWGSDSIEVSDLAESRAGLDRVYGLTVDDLVAIQAANDWHETPEERRDAILSYLLLAYPELLAAS